VSLAAITLLSLGYFVALWIVWHALRNAAVLVYISLGFTLCIIAILQAGAVAVGGAARSVAAVDGALMGMS
jgi:hypothetical protein